jgi:hypothetical protein
MGPADRSPTETEPQSCRPRLPFPPHLRQLTFTALASGAKSGNLQPFIMTGPLFPSVPPHGYTACSSTCSDDASQRWRWLAWVFRTESFVTCYCPLNGGTGNRMSAHGLRYGHLDSAGQFRKALVDCLLNVSHCVPRQRLQGEPAIWPSIFTWSQDGPVNFRRTLNMSCRSGEVGDWRCVQST